MSRQIEKPRSGWEGGFLVTVHSVPSNHAGNLDCVEHLRTHLQLIFSMLKYNTDKQALYNFVRERLLPDRRAEAAAKNHGTDRMRGGV